MIKFIDIAINILFPLLAGVVIYFMHASPLLRNHLPDGLWAYAFTSSILIIWNRKINFLWLSFTACSFIVFELLQALQLVKGTGDLLDTVIYFMFGLVAIGVNLFFKQFYNNTTYEYKN